MALGIPKRLYIPVIILSITSFILSLVIVIYEPSRGVIVASEKSQNGRKNIYTQTTHSTQEKPHSKHNSGHHPEVQLNKPTQELERRQRELADWKRQHEHSRTPLSMCEAFTPFRYPASGISVPPLQSTYLHGLALHDAAADILQHHERVRIKLRCRHARGMLAMDMVKSGSEVTVIGDGSDEITIESNKTEIKTINSALSRLQSKSTVYDIETRDVVDVTMLDFAISMHIHIKRPILPILYDPGPSADINTKVTIITKTFERYNALRRLISSIHKFYPNMTIIFADDSEFPEKINKPYVKQYFMPFAEGWFAGRNLALSQVRTKYFVWVDDDFVFTAKTRLENFLEKFEHPHLAIDLIGGSFIDEHGKPKTKSNCFGCRTVNVTYTDDDGEGVCLHISVEKKYHRVEEFPNCFYADGTTNFFMARTSTIKTIGFDPFYERIGHREFILDGLGKMRVMGCTDVYVHHLSDRSNKKYNLFRNSNRESSRTAYHTLFKNNLKCIH
ncbi:beta-1,4 N-acetylgalactosaminyltransferase 1-like [Glandiceps talaboti]